MGSKIMMDEIVWVYSGSVSAFPKMFIRAVPLPRKQQLAMVCRLVFKKKCSKLLIVELDFCLSVITCLHLRLLDGGNDVINRNNCSLCLWLAIQKRRIYTPCYNPLLSVMCAATGVEQRRHETCQLCLWFAMRHFNCIQRYIGAIRSPRLCQVDLRLVYDQRVFFVDA